MTPDTPLTAAWAAELYFLERALVAGRSGAWLGAGLFLGIGLVSKYSIGLLVPSALLFILLDPQSRRWLRRWEPYAAALIALAIFSPVIVWNAQNEWASFVFQADRRQVPKHDAPGSSVFVPILIYPRPPSRPQRPYAKTATACIPEKFLLLSRRTMHPADGSLCKGARLRAAALCRGQRDHFRARKQCGSRNDR